MRERECVRERDRERERERVCVRERERECVREREIERERERERGDILLYVKVKGSFSPLREACKSATN